VNLSLGTTVHELFEQAFREIWMVAADLWLILAYHFHLQIGWERCSSLSTAVVLGISAVVSKCLVAPEYMIANGDKGVDFSS